MKKIFLLLILISIQEVLHADSIEQNVIVAVIDSGINPSAANLMSALMDGINLVHPNAPMQDYDDHGTPVASVIVSIAPNAKILPLTVAEHGSATSKDVVDAFVYAYEHGVQIINVSLSLNNQILHEVKKKIGEAPFRNALIVVAAGNYGEEFSDFDLDWSNIIVVGALSLNESPMLASYSHYGARVDIAAPAGEVGEGLHVTSAFDCKRRFNGTSAAAPVISGIAAQLKAEEPFIDALGLKEKIFARSVKRDNINVNEGRTIEKEMLPAILFRD